MHPLFAQLLRRRPAIPFLAVNPAPGPASRSAVLPFSLPASREPGARHTGHTAAGITGTQSTSGIVVSMSRPPRRADTAWAEPAVTSVDIMLDDLPDADRPLSPGLGCSSQDGVRLRIDPKDHRRVRISGNMREVCAALDALIAVQ